ncbi:MAG: cupin domain-containing protein, partial [Acidobacteria bacterium]|nr:cupin domain-containing protein [Acidobacteriota bacterium]
IAELKVPIKAVNARTTREQITVINLTLEITNTEQLEKIIKKLKLKPLKLEGGFYFETYRSKEKIKINGKEKSLSTAIFFFLKKGEVSKPHRLKYDEIYHFYAGDPVNLYLVYADGRKEKKVLGANVLKGELPQIIIPKMTWQSAKLKKGGKYALMGTTVSPAFDFEDLEINKI